MELKIGISRGLKCWCSWPFKKAASGKETPCHWRATATAAAAVPTKTRPCRTGKHHGPQGRMESKIGVSRRRNVPSKNRLEKACYTFYVSQCWLCWLLARCRCSYCYWCCWNPRQKSSIGAAAAAGAADPSKRQLPARKPHATEGRQRLLLCPQRHGPAGRRNTMALKDERSPKYTLYTPVTGLDLLCKHVQSS